MPENTESTPEKSLMERVSKLLNVEYLPPMEPSEVRSLNKALPGYQAIADDTARLIQKDGKILNLDPSVLADLEQGIADVARLEPAEWLLEKLYLSVYHQRLQATDKCMGAMYDTARRIRDFAEAYPEVAEDGHFLLDFMKAFRPGRKKEKKEHG
uniref:Uncharacterized protein n=1 Tax=Candidatus Kentrum sp. MB TaxID=2138164 RepID=A0A450XF18_9GAMM|nr:MAG: hypothetical protein BECKMB1821G_GA0114241_100517 [Candidatus Kentron sp. MB]VFK27885.1 MAG: hypothetical protein BECKMB1821I_GA0114274_100516 [Candidatus Kentron sp. MB]VFK74451.1 MAG: hypothetical protein BECKMB1821H_GA0114242_100516 [Candidatus Kentron sp. MB]